MTQTRPNAKWPWIAAAVVIVAIIAAAAARPISPDSEPVPHLGAAPIRLTSQELIARYNDNAVKADQELTGETVAVSGVIDQIDRDRDGRGYLTMGGLIKATMEPSAESTLSTLHRNGSTTVTCEVAGKAIMIRLIGCEFR